MFRRMGAAGFRPIGELSARALPAPLRYASKLRACATADYGVTTFAARRFTAANSTYLKASAYNSALDFSSGKQFTIEINRRLASGFWVSSTVADVGADRMYLGVGDFTGSSGKFGWWVQSSGNVTTLAQPRILWYNAASTGALQAVDITGGPAVWSQCILRIDLSTSTPTFKANFDGGSTITISGGANSGGLPAGQTSALLQIGGGLTTGGRYFDGNLSCCRIWSGLLSDGVVSSLYPGKSTLPLRHAQLTNTQKTNVVASYDLATAGTEVDQGPNGINLSDGGTATTLEQLEQQTVARFPVGVVFKPLAFCRARTYVASSPINGKPAFFTPSHVNNSTDFAEAMVQASIPSLCLGDLASDLFTLSYPTSLQSPADAHFTVSGCHNAGAAASPEYAIQMMNNASGTVTQRQQIRGHYGPGDASIQIIGSGVMTAGHTYCLANSDYGVTNGSNTNGYNSWVNGVQDTITGSFNATYQNRCWGDPAGLDTLVWGGLNYNQAGIPTTPFSNLGLDWSQSAFCGYQFGFALYGSTSVGSGTTAALTAAQRLDVENWFRAQGGV